MQQRVYVLVRQVLAVYFDDLGKGCVQVPRGAVITVIKDEQPFLQFSWDYRTLRAFAEDIKSRSQLLPSALVQHAGRA